MIKFWRKRVKDRSNFWDGNRVAESWPLRRDLEVSHLWRRDSACDALIRPKYTFAACARIPGGSSSGRYPTQCPLCLLSLSLSVCHLTPMACTRASLRFWRSLLFGAATNWKLPSRARGRREIEINWFFRRAGLSPRPRPPRFTIFGRNSRSRSWEAWRARGALERLGRRKKAKQGAGASLFSLVHRILSNGTRCVTHAESIGASASMTGIITIRRRKEKKNKNHPEKRHDRTRNCLPPKLDRSAYSRRLRERFIERRKSDVECVRLAVGHAGIIKRPFELVPALILLNVRSDHRWRFAARERR